MSKNTLYFSVNVSNANDEHIGTMAVDKFSPQTFTEKVKTACQEHFDADVEIPELNINDYLQGRSGTVEIKINSDVDSIDEIFICETWIY